MEVTFGKYSGPAWAFVILARSHGWHCDDPPTTGSATGTSTSE